VKPFELEGEYEFVRPIHEEIEAGLADAKAGRVTGAEDLKRQYGLRR
jgi:predicted transcriptional regulator